MGEPCLRRRNIYVPEGVLVGGIDGRGIRRGIVHSSATSTLLPHEIATKPCITTKRGRVKSDFDPALYLSLFPLFQV